LVLRGRAHRGAERRAVDEDGERRHEAEADREDRDLDRADRRAAHQVGARGNDLRKREHVAAPDEERDVLQDDRDTDGGDERSATTAYTLPAVSPLMICCRNVSTAGKPKLKIKTAPRGVPS